MRLSDLLHARVYDAGGRDVGAVHDVRLVQDGPLQLPFGHAFRVDELVVGRGGLLLRLGFHHGGVERPAPLRAILRALAGRPYVVPWDDVAGWDGDRVDLRVAASDLT